MSSPLTLASEHRCFGGSVAFYRHASQACGGEMRFGVFTPPQAASRKVPVLYYLAGLTCTEETFLAKGGAQRLAAELGVMLVAPDTSPRGAGLPGEDDAWDFGTGAGFYVDATQPPWASRYRMYTYVTQELPALVTGHLPARPDREGIFGHSMGGHGALVCALRQPGRYRSVSAFAPIAAPMRCPWGKKAFGGYLGPDTEAWKAWDASELVRGLRQPLPALLVDQGTRDKFLAEQLLPEQLREACAAVGQPLTLRMQEGYDHSYFFVSTFMEDHLRHHAAALNA
ncbi:S-formylglutathione hydrolase [Stigmatella aurantiaca]|uniref:S-formylglutathione hydrolase n=1 Tax=Stigmatella aurantiaca TaxID=41 RepID=A0A1H7RTX0_STIAU|nr:S-formylglutathione hydrolase [Stigmatella aurantiaca]SEL62867.1 S-formylglutathione hydrolase [Stigmatella aurantiaca]